jgi:hypothetical protein
MTKDINLLTKKKDYENKEKVFRFFRKISIISGFLIVALLLIIFLFQQKIKTQYQELLSKKEQKLNQLLQKKEIEKKMLYINEKSISFKKNLQEDVSFLPYYHILLGHFPISSESANIKLIVYNNKRDVELLLNFYNYQDLYQSLGRLEEEKFLNLFDHLSLNSFSLSEEKMKSYQLTLKGKFKPIENAN